MLKETVVKINTNDGSFHKDFGIKTSKGGPGSKSHWDISLKKKSKRPSNDLQKASFCTFCKGHCKGSLDICRIATMTSPPLETISINVFLEAPKMR
jgi:hypothetical protein